MNRIEIAMNALKNKGNKAFITYMTAGMPNKDTCLNIIKAQAEAGVDVIELGIPFSDPVADGPVIQQESFNAINNGVNIFNTFELMEELRQSCEVPIIFMLYYNTILNFGVKKFIQRCIKCGVDGLIVPDLPFEESEELSQELTDAKAPLLIPLISPISNDRIPMILKGCRGFVYCVSSMGVTGQNAQNFHKNTKEYLANVKKQSSIPVIMGFGIKEYKDVEPFINSIDGCIVGSHFINILHQSKYDSEVAAEYIKNFKSCLNN